MPPRRRGGRAKARTKTPQETRAKDSSSAEDTDGKAAKEIVQRLAKKYLLMSTPVVIKKHLIMIPIQEALETVATSPVSSQRKKSSTDTTDSEQKENVSSKGQLCDPYDGDLETDGGVTTTSDMECQTDESSLMDDQDVLSPSRKINKPASMAKAAFQRRKHGQQASSRRTRQQKKLITYEQQKNTSIKRRSDIEQASRGSQTDSEDEPQSSKKSKLNSLQQGDSGLHISPLIYGRPIPKLPRMKASDTSTPSSAAVGRSLDDSCFGFDHMVSPQGLPFSPVQSVLPEDGSHRPGSAMSSSYMSSFAGSSIMSPPAPKRRYDNVNLTGLIPSENEQKDMPAAKKPKKKKKMPAKVEKKNEHWASQMSAEFDDIDMYELTIEG